MDLHMLTSDTPGKGQHSESGCPFCARIAFGEHISHLSNADAVVFAPLGPVVVGHLLVVPRVHVVDATSDPAVTAASAALAARVMAALGGDHNLITSIGPAATQTIRHLHWHLVPRAHGDRIALPWTGQRPAFQSGGGAP